MNKGKEVYEQGLKYALRKIELLYRVGME